MTEIVETVEHAEDEAVEPTRIVTRPKPKKPKKAKKPQDHKPKTEKAKVEKVDGGKRVTLHGVTVTVLDGALDDFEVLDDIRAVQDEGDPSRFPSLLRRLVGEQYRTVLEALRDGESGRVSVERGVVFTTELLQALNPN